MIGVALAFSLAAFCASPNVQEIVDRSAATIKADWDAAPNYAYTERDIESKHGHAKTTKTFRVWMIGGSPYRELIAINDRPLSDRERGLQLKKVQYEILQRKDESARERERRIEKYRKERHQDFALMQQMAVAFHFKLVGDETLNGHKVWVLDATPKPDYQPINEESKVLTGMKGRLWISQNGYQWVKVQAEVVRPVYFLGVLAKVQPGTRFELDQEPVAPGLWLPKHFSQNVIASALGFIDESSTDDESYWDYKPMASLAQLTQPH